MDFNQIKELLTPERIEQAKGVAATFFALGGWDMITGAVSNKKYKRISVILKATIRVSNRCALIFDGIANGLQRVQDYGNDKI